MGRTVCTEPQCLYSTAIPLRPLWAVRSVQSLSDCTVELYIYVPYGPYGPYSLSDCTVELYIYVPYGPYGLYSLSDCTFFTLYLRIFVSAGWRGICVRLPFTLGVVLTVTVVHV